MRVDQSFLGAEGVGETIERRLWAAGVTHWDAFETDRVGPTRADAIQSFIERGERALAAGDPHFFDEALPSASRWRVYETFPERACFLDIETTGLDHRHHRVTTVSIHHAGRTRTLVRGDDLGAESLRAALAPADILVTYNGAQFDVPFLEASFDVDVDLVHLDLMYPCRRLGWTGGLDGVERELGLRRDGPDISGEDAVRLWREHERGRDGALETLIAYNREDTEVMVDVVDRMTAALDDEVFVE